MLLNTLNAVLKGLQRFDVLAKTTLGFSLATTLVAVLVLVAGGRLLEVVVASALMTTANLAAVIFLLFRYVPRYRPTHRISREALRSLLSFGAYTFITKVAGALNTYFLQVIIALILGAAAVAYFTVPLRFTIALEAGMTSLIGVIFPFVSALKARANIESLQKLYSSTSKYVVALSTPLYLFLILFSQQILRLWLGAPFAQNSWLVLAFLAGGSLLAAWTMVPANTAFGTGHTKITAAFSLIVITMNVLFSVLFTLRWGVTGTAVAVLLTALQGPVFIWYVTSHVVRIPPRQYFAQVFAFHIAPALGFSLLSLGILWAIKAQNWSADSIAVASGAALTVMYYLLLLRGGVVSVRKLSRVSEPAALPG
jgi:O-antigen/teichoic acid export membrane protein